MINRLKITYNRSLRPGLRFIVTDPDALICAESARRLEAINMHLEESHLDILPFTESEMEAIVRGSLLKAAEKLNISESAALHAKVERGI